MSWRYGSKTWLATCAVLIIAGCDATGGPTNDEIVAHYAPYLGDLEQLQSETITLPRQPGSEGSGITIYRETGSFSVREIMAPITYGVWIIRLLSDDEYPDLLSVRRLQWNPDAYPDERIIEYDETDLFTENAGEWVIFLHDGGYPLERVPRLIERFDAAIEFMASNES